MATPYTPYREERDHHRVPAALRAPLETRTWRELGYVLTGLPVAIALFVWAVTTVSLGAGLLVTFVGVPVLALA
ncbi:sensor domain-containing protein, partial [Streptomyces eurythermus]